MSARAFGTVLVMLAVAACAEPEAPDADGAWVGTITTEGNVTTVINESGSVWGGTARLVEEASIGVDAGEDPYMLGRVRSVATFDDRIYVADSQVPALRVYDWSGTYLNDLGDEGEGPGEFRFPAAVGVDATGRVWLHDESMRRIVVFAPGGEAIATLNLGGSRISGNFPQMTVTADGQAYIFGIVRPDDPEDTSGVRRVMTPYDIDGVAGEPIEIPRLDNPGGSSPALLARADGAIRFVSVPFLAGWATAFAPTRAMLAGRTDTYRFEILYPDGNKRTVVERNWEPVAVLPDEAAAHQDAATRYMREMDPEWTWPGAEIPNSKPAYSQLLPAVSGEIWVSRPGPASAESGCDEESFPADGEAHCWPEQRIVDVFDAEGRYLGDVSVPPNLSLEPLPFIRGNDVIARVEDESGTIMVKRYRLVLPGER